MMRFSKAMLTLTVLALVGCAGFERNVPTKFLLDPGEPPSFAGMRRSGTAAVSFVGVDLRSAAGGFVYKVSATEWEVDPYNGFLVSPSQMLTSIVRQWVSDSQQFSTVAVAGDPGGQDWVIRCAVSEFYGDFQNPSNPEAVLAMGVQLFRNQGGKLTLVTDATFERRVPVAARRPEALVEAWNAALREVLTELSRTIAQ